MDIKTIKKTLQHIIDDVLPKTDHNVASLDMQQVQNDDGFEVHLSIKLKTEKSNDAGFGFNKEEN